MHNATEDLMGASVTGPDLGTKLYKIEMRGDSGWVTLGGIFDELTSETRIVQFSEHFMTSPSGTAAGRTCKKEFRRVQCSKDGHPV